MLAGSFWSRTCTATSGTRQPSQMTLLDGRWLLGGGSRVSSDMWHKILEVDPSKQLLFLESR